MLKYAENRVFQSQRSKQYHPSAQKSQKDMCHSSGNHAQAVSFVAMKLGLPAFIVMPSDTPSVKKNAVKHYKAEIIESGPTQKDQE